MGRANKRAAAPVAAPAAVPTAAMVRSAASKRKPPSNSLMLWLSVTTFVAMLLSVLSHTEFGANLSASLFDTSSPRRSSGRRGGGAPPPARGSGAEFNPDWFAASTGASAAQLAALQVNSEFYARAAPVPTKLWDKSMPASDFISGIAKGRTPVVLKRSPLNDAPNGWAALNDPAREWNANYLSREVKKMYRVHRQPRAAPNHVSGQTDVFWYAESKGRAWQHQYSTPLTHPSEKIDTLNATDFYRHVTTADDEFAYKYSAEVHDSFRSVLRDLKDRIRSLAVADSELTPPAPGEEEEESPQAATYVWIGGRNVTSQSHYDPVHNLYVQLYGRKRFILSPPCDSGSFYLFPYQHASDRNSQVDHSLFESADREVRDRARAKFPLSGAGTATAYVVELEKGDVLYLPPFWFHRVSGSRDSDLSVSVNVWTDSREGDLLAAAIRRAEPVLNGMRQTPDAEIQMLALRAFITSILLHLLPPHNGDATHTHTFWSATAPPSSEVPLTPAQFIANLQHTRYGPSDTAHYFCDEPAVVKEIDARCPPFRGSGGGSGRAIEMAEFERALNEAAPLTASIAELWSTYLGAVHSPRRLHRIGVDTIVLESFIEHSVHTVLGLKPTCAFFQFCLNGIPH